MGAIDTHDLAARLLADLPDVPRWIETRAMLRSPQVQVIGGPAVADGVAVRLFHGAMSVVSLVGRPPAYAIAAALEGTTTMTPIIVQTDNWIARIMISSGIVSSAMMFVRGPIG